MRRFGVGIFLFLFAIPFTVSSVHAIFRGFPGSLGVTRPKTVRIIIKFKDGQSPRLSDVLAINQQIGVISMRPLFTNSSVGPSLVGSTRSPLITLLTSRFTSFFTRLSLIAIYAQIRAPHPTPTITPTPFPLAPPPIVGTSAFVSNELQNFYVLIIDPNRAPPGQTFADIMVKYRAIPELESIEPDRPLHDLQQPNDSYYPKLWNLQKINIETVWNQQAMLGTEVKVGVVDSGINQNHEDLIGLSFIHGRDYATCEEFDGEDSCLRPKNCPKENEGYCSDTPDDDNGHGTHVTGIMAGVIGNSKGIAGISNKVKVIPVKVLNQAGDTFESWTFEGLVYAVHQGAKVINLSIGGCASLTTADGSCSHETKHVSTGFKRVLDYAIRRNVVVVVAAGNENDEAQWYTPPNYNNTPGTAGKIIIVGATGPNDERAFYSNYGAIVDIAAPGGNVTNNDRNNDGVVETEDCKESECILSTYLDAGHTRFITDYNDPHYESYMGTSMAAPHIAGTAALLFAKTPTLTLARIISIINGTSDPIVTDKPIGGKRVNAGKAIIVEAVETFSSGPACDKCGWCDDGTTKPPHWDACRACLYDVDGFEKNDSIYTMFGCFSAPSGQLAPTIVKSTLSTVFGISGGIAFLKFLYGAFLLMTSRGMPERISNGKHMVVSAIAGLLLIIFSVFILRTLGYDILQIPGFG